MSAALAAVPTNDVSLFLVVPLALAIDRAAQVPRQRLVIFEALAVNVGGAGWMIGSLANLIALRLDGSRGIGWRCHA